MPCGSMRPAPSGRARGIDPPGRSSATFHHEASGVAASSSWLIRIIGDDGRRSQTPPGDCVARIQEASRRRPGGTRAVDTVVRLHNGPAIARSPVEETPAVPWAMASVVSPPASRGCRCGLRPAPLGGSCAFVAVCRWSGSRGNNRRSRSFPGHKSSHVHQGKHWRLPSVTVPSRFTVASLSSFLRCSSG